MEKRIYNPLNEGYTGGNLDAEGYNGSKATKNDNRENENSAPSIIPFQIISGVTNPNSNNSNNANSNLNSNTNSNK